MKRSIWILVYCHVFFQIYSWTAFYSPCAGHCTYLNHIKSYYIMILFYFCYLPSKVLSNLLWQALLLTDKRRTMHSFSRRKCLYEDIELVGSRRGAAVVVLWKPLFHFTVSCFLASQILTHTACISKLKVQIIFSCLPDFLP